MTVRAPRPSRLADRDPLSATLEQEIFSEKASTLSRLTLKLEKALAHLAELDADASVPQDPDSEREKRLAEAGEALWYVTIQRELCGLREHREFYNFLKVPRPVRLRMGLQVTRAPAPASAKPPEV